MTEECIGVPLECVAIPRLSRHPGQLHEGVRASGERRDGLLPRRTGCTAEAFVDRGLTEVIQDDDEVWSRIDQRGERRQLLVPNAGVESEPARSGGLQTRGELREDGRGQVLQEMPDADHAACPHQCVQLIDNAT